MVLSNCHFTQVGTFQLHYGETSSDNDAWFVLDKNNELDFYYDVTLSSMFLSLLTRYKIAEILLMLVLNTN
jgi:hypothetical protein